MVLEEQLKCEPLIDASYGAALTGVARFVASHGGTLDQAKDIFHDALLIFYEQRTSPSVTVSPEAYIIGIARHLWIKRFKNDSRYVALDDYERKLHVPDDFFPTIDEEKLLNTISQTGRRCLDLLKSFFYDRLSIDDIKLTFGFRSAHSASVQKYKCIEKIRERVNKEKLRYEDFID